MDEQKECTNYEACKAFYVQQFKINKYKQLEGDFKKNKVNVHMEVYIYKGIWGVKHFAPSTLLRGISISNRMALHDQTSTSQLFFPTFLFGSLGQSFHKSNTRFKNAYL